MTNRLNPWNALIYQTLLKHEKNPSESFSENDIGGSGLLVNTVDTRTRYLAVIFMG